MELGGLKWANRFQVAGLINSAAGRPRKRPQNTPKHASNHGHGDSRKGAGYPCQQSGPNGIAAPRRCFNPSPDFPLEISRKVDQRCGEPHAFVKFAVSHGGVMEISCIEYNVSQGINPWKIYLEVRFPKKVVPRARRLAWMRVPPSGRTTFCSRFHAFSLDHLLLPDTFAACQPQSPHRPSSASPFAPWLLKPWKA